MLALLLACLVAACSGKGRGKSEQDAGYDGQDEDACARLERPSVGDDGLEDSQDCRTNGDAAEPSEAGSEKPNLEADTGTPIRDAGTSTGDASRDGSATGPNDANQPPSTLWSPPPSTLPKDKSYVYLESDQGDHIGQGAHYLYTLADARIEMKAVARELTVFVNGFEHWHATFRMRLEQGELLPGYYPDLEGAWNTWGGLEWVGEGRTCTALRGWLAIDHIVIAGEAVRELDLRFEQHCDNRAPALRGAIHFRADDPTRPQNPRSPPPADLWAPAAGSVPANGNYVYLHGQPGGSITERSYLYTQRDSILRVDSWVGNFAITVLAEEHWDGLFEGPVGRALSTGYYDGVRRLYSHNPTRGGISWTGGDRGCDRSNGWVAIDSLSLGGGGMVSAIELRFAQSCDGLLVPLYGAIRWRSDDPTTFPGPREIPAELWRPPAGQLPSAGNYVYLLSDPGDAGGGGQTTTLSSSAFSVSTAEGSVSFTGDWNGEFRAMRGYAQVAVGYYPDLRRSGSHNPAKGGLLVRNGGGCNELSGWFAVDSSRYDTAGALREIDLRFEQRCEPGGPTLRGQLNYQTQ